MDYDHELDEWQYFIAESRHTGDPTLPKQVRGGQHLHDCPDTEGGNRCAECLLEMLIRQVFWLRLELASYNDGTDLQALLNERGRIRREEERIRHEEERQLREQRRTRPDA